MTPLQRLFLGGMERRGPATLSEALTRLRADGGGSASPVVVSPESAMRHAAVWSSVNFISDLIATLPIDEFRRVDMRRAEQVELSPVIADPSDTVTPEGWRRQALVSLLLRGNTVGYVTQRDDLARPRLVEILNPDQVGVKRDGKLGPLRFSWWGTGELARDDVWHVAGYLYPGSPVGMSPIAHLAETIGLGIAASRFGANWFEKGAHPSALLVNEKKLDEEMATEAKRRFTRSVRQGEPAVLGDGWTYEKLSVSAEESQFLDTISANRATVATIYGLRPEDIGEKSGDSQTYSNIEQRQIARLVYPISQWIATLERRMNSLIAEDRFVKLQVDALLRADLRTRYQAHDSAIRAGWKSRNEVRELEDMPPIDEPEGDETLWPPYRVHPFPSEDPNA